jgi:hypothetical protein
MYTRATIYHSYLTHYKSVQFYKQNRIYLYPKKSKTNNKKILSFAITKLWKTIKTTLLLFYPKIISNLIRLIQQLFQARSYGVKRNNTYWTMVLVKKGKKKYYSFEDFFLKLFFWEFLASSSLIQGKNYLIVTNAKFL